MCACVCARVCFFFSYSHFQLFFFLSLSLSPFRYDVFFLSQREFHAVIRCPADPSLSLTVYGEKIHKQVSWMSKYGGTGMMMVLFLVVKGFLAKFKPSKAFAGNPRQAQVRTAGFPGVPKKDN